MHASEWQQPPVRFEDLAIVLELLGADAKDVLRGWVLVPGHESDARVRKLTETVERLVARLPAMWAGDL